VLTAQAQSPALHVIGITGKWTAGKQQLVIGSSVSASSVLAGDAGATIMLGSSAGRYFKSCEDACQFTPSSEKPQSEPGEQLLIVCRSSVSSTSASFCAISAYCLSRAVDWMINDPESGATGGSFRTSVTLFFSFPNP